MSDDVDLPAAQAGDTAALERLLQRHQAQIFRFGTRMCRNPEDAQDVLQETLLAMARGVRDFRGASSLSTWLYTIARRACVKQRRRSKFAPTEERSLDASPSDHDAALRDPAPGAEQIASDHEVQRALLGAIRSLEPAYKEVLVLRDVEGLTAPEVAEVLDVSVDAVKSRLHRARLQVRQAVEPMLGLHPDAPKAPGTCPDVLLLFSRHLEDEIEPALCAQMEAHLATCPRCRGTCDSLKRTLSLCRTGPADSVPEDVQREVRAAVKRFLAQGGAG